MKTANLEGKKGLVFGIANSSSLAYGCASAFRDLGPNSPSPIADRKPSPTSARSRKSWPARSSCPAT